MPVCFSLCASIGYANPCRQSAARELLMMTRTLIPGKDATNGKVAAAASQGDNFRERLTGLKVVFVVTDYYLFGKDSLGDIYAFDIKWKGRYYAVLLYLTPGHDSTNGWIPREVRAIAKPSAPEAKTPLFVYRPHGVKWESGRLAFPAQPKVALSQPAGGGGGYTVTPPTPYMDPPTPPADGSGYAVTPPSPYSQPPTPPAGGGPGYLVPSFSVYPPMVVQGEFASPIGPPSGS